MSQIGGNSPSQSETRTGFREIVRYLIPYKKELVFLSFLGIISAITNALIPFIMGRFFDELIIPTMYSVPLLGFVSGAFVLLAIWFCIQVIANSFDWVLSRRSRKMGIELQSGYQAHAFIQMLFLPISFHKQERVGGLSRIIDKASWMLESIVANVGISLAPQFLSIIIGVTIGFFINPILATILLLGLALYLVMLVKILKPVAGYESVAQEAWRDAYALAHDAYANVTTVKHAGAEDFERARIEHAFFKEAAPLWNKLEFAWSNITFFQRFIVVGTQLSIFICSVFFVASNTISIGELIAFNAYAALIFGPFVSLGTQWQNIQNGIISLAKAEYLFSTPREPYGEDEDVSLKIDGAVDFQKVQFSYEEGQQEVLRSISFSAKPGETIALVGETGAGKSTVADLISGYYFASVGNVLIDGQDIRTLPLRELRKHIAIVPQEVVLFNASIMDNIRYGRPSATDEEVRNVATQARANLSIEEFPNAYDQKVGERGIKLSVGQKQRVAIARAILRDPKILILDEPTSALDPDISESLDLLMQGRTTFIIAHRLSTVRKADKILVLQKGIIVEEGTHDMLMQKENGLYRRLYELHIGLRE